MKRTRSGRLRKVYRQLRATWRWWQGDDEYARYLRHCAAQNEAPLDRGRYFAQRLEERYKTTERCC